MMRKKLLRILFIGQGSKGVYLSKIRKKAAHMQAQSLGSGLARRSLTKSELWSVVWLVFRDGKASFSLQFAVYSLQFTVLFNSKFLVPCSLLNSSSPPRASGPLRNSEFDIRHSTLAFLHFRRYSLKNPIPYPHNCSHALGTDKTATRKSRLTRNE
jgi:hypothetical protein